MPGLARSLKNKVELWGNIPYENELGEFDRKHSKIKDLWVRIQFSNGMSKNNSDKEESNSKLKFTVRNKSIPNLTSDMFFIYKNQKYCYDYHVPNYKYSDSIDIFCTLVVE